MFSNVDFSLKWKIKPEEKTNISERIYFIYKKITGKIVSKNLKKKTLILLYLHQFFYIYIGKLQ